MPSETIQEPLPLVPEGIARGAGEEDPVLIGGHCPACERDFFPRPRYCPQCLEPTQEQVLGGEGVIHSYTVVRTRPPLGLPQPYPVGYLDLAGSGLRVFGLLDPEQIGDMAIGRAVRLTVGQVGNDRQGQPCLRPYFTLSQGEGQHG